MLWTFDRMYIFFLLWLLLLYFYTRARFYFWGEQKPRTCQKVPQKTAGKIGVTFLIYVAIQVEADEDHLVILTYLLLLILYTSLPWFLPTFFTCWSSFAPEIQPCPRDKSSMTIKASINGAWCTWETIKIRAHNEDLWILLRCSQERRSRRIMQEKNEFS